jgi:ribosomal protein L37AE/L43A
MDYVTCPNCGEKFKADTSKKYYDCPNCSLEFAERDLPNSTSGPKTTASSSLLEKINNAKKKT